MDVDSTGYLSAAVNLVHGRGLTGIGGVPFTLFGPALPIFLSLGVRLGMSAQAADLVLNILSAISTVLLGRILLKRHVSDANFVFAGSLLISVGWPLVQVTSLATTEPLTIVALLALILILEDFNQTQRPCISLTAIVVLLNLTFFLRYAGLGFIPAGIVFVFFGRSGLNDLSWRVRSTLLTTFFSLLGPGLWMIRNHGVDGSLLGPRYPPVFSVTTVANQYVLAVAKFLLPGPRIFEDFLFLLVVLTVVLTLRLIYVKVPGGVSEYVRKFGPWAVLLFVCASYGSYLFAAELSTKIDPIDSRLLVPIYIPGVILGVGLAERVFSLGLLGRRSENFAKKLLASLLGAQVLITCVLVGDFAVNGRDFASDAWRTSSLVTASKMIPSNDLIYTNNAAGLWARIGTENIYSLPSSKAKVRKLSHCSNIQVVFFAHKGGPYYGDSNKVTSLDSSLTLKNLESILRLERIFSNSQGDIFRVLGNSSAISGCR